MFDRVNAPLDTFSKLMLFTVNKMSKLGEQILQNRVAFENSHSVESVLQVYSFCSK